MEYWRDLKRAPASMFTRDPVGLKDAADKGPVVISAHGRPRYVLMSIADHEKIRDELRRLRALAEDFQVRAGK